MSITSTSSNMPDSLPSTSEQPVLSRPVLVIGLVAAVLITGYGHLLHHGFFHDDAFITLRYSQNWLAGNGVNWNPDERVEGYTSFLHLAGVSLLGMLRLDLVTATQLIGLAAYAGICWLALTHFRDSTGSFVSLRQLLLMLMVPASFPLIAWSYGGLETSLVTLLVMAASYTFVSASDESNKRMLILGILFALACLARPDVGLLMAITLVFLLCPRDGKRSSKMAIVIFLAGFAVFYLPYFGWRYWYYGELLPNTFHAKMAGVDWFRLRTGGHYVHTFARIAPFLLPTTLLASLFLYRRDKWSWKTAYMLSQVAGHTVYIIYTGGDHMPAYRFFVPIIPLMGWIVANAGGEWADGEHSLAWLLAPLAIVLVLGQGFTRNERMLNGQRLDPAAAVGSDVGYWLEENLPAGSVVALNTAGSTPYYAKQLVFIDMLGLNDKQIAHRRDVPIRTRWQRYPGHAKGDGQYVLLRKPAIIILGPAQGLTADPTFENKEHVPWFLSDQELAESKAFQQRYRQQTVHFRGHSGEQRTLIYYQRQLNGGF